MAQATEVTFGDLQKEERFQKLQRTLKLRFLKSDPGAMSSRESTLVSTWPSLSSINVDHSDPNSTIRSLQNSRVGSEVISSSNNLKNLMWKNKHSYHNKEHMATSSIKQYPTNQYNANDRDIMPPPTIQRVPHGYKKKSNTNAVHSNLNNQESASEKCSDMIQKSDNMDMKLNMGCSSHMGTTEAPKKQVRTFSRWRVMLNKEGQLIIKGTLECGKIARSKSVIRRLTSTSVESIYKHTYHLQGNIVDERHELPDYVRGKFYSGFPDDWENVYQIWRSFVAQNCKVTFRWPTPITDSDDDLKSELTDVTSTYRGGRNAKALHSESLDRTFTSPSAEHRPCSRQTLDNERRNMHCCCFNTNGSIKTETSTPCSRNEMIVQDDKFSNKENNKQLQNISLSSASRQPSKLKDIIREEKLNIIIENLTSKNCPQTYIDKIIEMFDCLDYVVSYRSATESEYDLSHSNVQNPSKSRNDEKKCNSREEKRSVPSMNEENHIDELRRRDAVPKNDEIETPRRIISNYESSDNSESETYAGVRKIPVARIMQKRAAVPRSPKRRRRYKSTNTSTEKQVEQSTRPTQTSPRCADSSVSITEDEIELAGIAKHCRPEKHVEVHRNQFARHALNYEQNTRTLHHENFTSSYLEELKSQAKANEITNNPKQQPMYSSTKTAHQENTQSKYQAENIAYEPPDESHANMKVQTNQKSKPTIINSIQLNNMSVRIADKETEFQNCASDVSFVENEGKGSDSTGHAEKPINEESKRTSSSYKPKSPHTKKVNKSPNSDLSPRDKTQNATIDPQPESGLKNTAKSPRALRSMKNKEPKPERTPQLLTSWTPKVMELDSALGLVFEGKLLNEAGHVVHRKFTTSVVRKRISTDLVETVNHELYRLLGTLHDAKHVVPKELVKHCLNGCPSKIDHFCKMWKSLQADGISKSIEKTHDATMDTMNIPVSSRGRRILPPLNYWTGERVVLRDNNLVYSPGHSQESTISSAYDSPEQNSKVVEKKLQEKSKTLPKMSQKTMSTSKIPDKTSTTLKKAENDSDPRKVPPRSKKRIVQQLKFSSSEESSEERNVKSVRRKSTHSPRESKSTSTSRQYASKQRKRAKMENGIEKSTDQNIRKVSPRKAQHDVTYAYYQNVPAKDDTLSDDITSEF